MIGAFATVATSLALAFAPGAVPAGQVASSMRAPTVRVTPATVHPGGRVRVFGSVGGSPGRLGCPAGDLVALLSRAFAHSRRDFAGVPTVYAKVARDGSFSVRTKVPARRRPGRYRISARCGGANLGVSATLRVRSR